MRNYRSTITLGSACATPWQADTLFGHLCWSLVRRRGEGFLTNDFLATYRRNEPPVLISDGFPHSFLPRPRAPARQQPNEGLPKVQRVRDYRATKDQMKARWLSLEEFNRARRGQAVSPGPQPQTTTRVVSKNRISRQTGTAADLFEFTELCLPAVEVYWRITDGYEALVREFLDDLQKTGYGKRKSAGYGQVTAITLEPWEGFPEVASANGFLTLSNFVPAASDPTEGYWSTAVKYGKLGEEAAGSAQPFKRPVLQMTAGSCFYHNGHPREWYGRLVSSVAADPQVMQYGFAFPVPMCLP
jgi:CRISPR-associated protein Csm4